jgi:hypothetical protein
LTAKRIFLANYGLALDSVLLELEPEPPAGALKNLMKSMPETRRNKAVAASIISVNLEIVFGVPSKDFSLAVAVLSLSFDVLSAIGFPL